MNKKQAEIEKELLEHEKQAFKDLKTAYDKAAQDIKARIMDLQGKLKELKAIDTKGFDDRSKEILESQIQSKVYQLEYQKMLDKQISSCIEVLKQDTVTNVSSYLYKVYEDSYLGSLYNINAAGIPITTPINPSLLVATVNKPTGDMKFSKFGTVTKKDKDGLTYVQRIERNMNDFKKKIKAEISRGIANGSSYGEIAQMISMVTGEDLHVSQRIVRTEGTRVSSEARLTQIRAAKEKGADLVKVWDSTLDGKTRKVHAELDQQVREVDEPFKAEGYETMGPGLFGDPSLDCNCRCCVLSVPRWDIEGKKIRRNNETDELIEVDNYSDWKKGYFRRVTDAELEGKGKDKTQKNKKTKSVKINNLEDCINILENMGVKYFDNGNKIDEKLMVENTQQFYDLVQKFPKVQEYINNNTFSFELFNDGKAIAYVRFGLFKQNRMSYVLCPSSYKKYEEFIDKEAEQMLKNWAMPCIKEKLSVYSATHEFGHVLHNILIKDYFDNNKEEHEKIKQRVLGTSLSRGKTIIKDANLKIIKGYFLEIKEIAVKENPNFSLKDNLSDYGKTDYAEAFAEIFANSQCGKPNELGKAMNIWLKEKGLIK